MDFSIKKNIFTKLKEIKFSNQIFLTNKIVDSVIINTNIFIMKNKNLLLETNFVILYDIINNIFSLKFSNEYKINIYLYYLKNFKNTKTYLNDLKEIKIIFDNLN